MMAAAEVTEEVSLFEVDFGPSDNSLVLELILTTYLYVFLLVLELSTTSSTNLKNQGGLVPDRNTRCHKYFGQEYEE